MLNLLILLYAIALNYPKYAQSTIKQVDLPYQTTIIGDKTAKQTQTLNQGQKGTLKIQLNTLNTPLGQIPTKIKIIEVHKPKTQKLQSVIKTNLGTIPYSKKLNVKTTAYSSEELALDASAGDPTITSTGHTLKKGIMAVDPKMIKLGTCAYIPGYGFAKALDTGGNIKQHRIDLAMNNKQEALYWGVRNKTIYIVSCDYWQKAWQN